LPLFFLRDVSTVWAMYQNLAFITLLRMIASLLYSSAYARFPLMRASTWAISRDSQLSFHWSLEFACDSSRTKSLKGLPCGNFPSWKN
jgi:hypothetical protein